MKTEELVQFITGIAEDFKAVDIEVLHVSGRCSFTDYLVIMSGTSTTQTRAIADEMIYKTKHAGHQAISIEGLVQGEWCLLDFGDVVVHIFLPDKRAHFALEELWREDVRPPAEASAEPSADA